MPKFQRPNIHGPAITKHVGKGYQQHSMLPSRHALNQLTKGDPVQRSLQNFGKLTPIGAGAPGTYADIENMGEQDQAQIPGGGNV